jgi:hypothetical protein
MEFSLSLSTRGESQARERKVDSRLVSRASSSSSRHSTLIIQMSSGNYHSRPSNYDSHASTTSPSLSVGGHRLIDKQREWNAFIKIHDQSQDLLRYFEQFGDKYDILDGGSEGKSHWARLGWAGRPVLKRTRRSACASHVHRRLTLSPLNNPEQP